MRRRVLFGITALLLAFGVSAGTAVAASAAPPAPPAAGGTAAVGAVQDGKQGDKGVTPLFESGVCHGQIGDGVSNVGSVEFNTGIQCLPPADVTVQTFITRCTRAIGGPPLCAVGGPNTVAGEYKFSARSYYTVSVARIACTPGSNDFYKPAARRISVNGVSYPDVVGQPMQVLCGSPR